MIAGEIRRGPAASSHGAHPAGRALPVPHAKLPQGADELVLRAAEGARLPRVPGQDIPGT